MPLFAHVCKRRNSLVIISRFSIFYKLLSHFSKLPTSHTMDLDFRNAADIGLNKYPRIGYKIFQYGTAGFREKASELPHITFRMGILAALRSKVKEGRTVGLMITASHNPEEDNGVKLCDPLGDMLNAEWEELATLLVNSNNECLSEVLMQIVDSQKINYSLPAKVYLAKDTRESSSSLLNAAIDGVKVLNGEAKDFGLLTTPQLHFVVCCKNNASYGSPTSEGYYEKLSDSFEKLTLQGESKKRYSPDIYIDGANGVGAVKLKELQPNLTTLNMNLFNDGSTGALNFMCGADYVKIAQKVPEGCDAKQGKRYASLDGDADRLVYFYLDDTNSFHLLDGDKIAALFAKFLKELVEKTGLDLAMKVVQTAYANGSSTMYIENNLKVPAICVRTGVKYLHQEAKLCDIGVYFEANGHGTVVFSEMAKLQIRELASSVNSSSDQKVSAEKLLSYIDLTNETVGDAISDLLLVEAILLSWDWSVSDWDAIYADLPNRQLKAKVPDRKNFLTVDADRICVQPQGLQEEINKAVSKFTNGRSFARASGTEDIVRIYAEADTQENADCLAQAVCLLVVKFADKP